MHYKYINIRREFKYISRISDLKTWEQVIAKTNRLMKIEQ